MSRITERMEIEGRKERGEEREREEDLVHTRESRHFCAAGSWNGPNGSLTRLVDVENRAKKWSISSVSHLREVACYFFFFFFLLFFCFFSSFASVGREMERYLRRVFTIEKLCTTPPELYSTYLTIRSDRAREFSDKLHSPRQTVAFSQF